jgi:hypothetical protein
MAEESRYPVSPAESSESVTQPTKGEVGAPLAEDASVSETGGAPQEVESDNEDQDLEEETSLGTADTADRTYIRSAGQMHFGPYKCLVRLTTKVQTHTILCGYFKDRC